MFKILVYRLLWGVDTKKRFDAKKAKYNENKISPRLKFQPFYEFIEKVFVAQHVFAMFSQKVFVIRHPLFILNIDVSA